MYSLPQLSTTYELAERIPHPEATFEGDTTLNNLDVNNYNNLKGTSTLHIIWLAPQMNCTPCFGRPHEQARWSLCLVHSLPLRSYFTNKQNGSLCSRCHDNVNMLL